MLTLSASLILVLVSQARSQESETCNGDSCLDAEDTTALLQTHVTQTQRSRSSRGSRDLVLVHIPFNFGHTIEAEAVSGVVGGDVSLGNNLSKFIARQHAPKEKRWEVLHRIMRPGGEIWGHVNPDLQVTSNVTGCPMYFTPQKHWPHDLAQKYFGDKVIFGMLRDPYERLVAMFRGDSKEYGGSEDQYISSCDVDGAVREMMEKTIAGDIYRGNCTFLPQAEYFDPPFGITLPVNNRLFPQSMNQVFQEHGYTDFVISTKRTFHVKECSEKWAGDLSCETKALIKKHYARDFDLLCKHFGYCDTTENCCIEGVPAMCPSNLEEKRRNATHCP